MTIKELCQTKDQSNQDLQDLIESVKMMSSSDECMLMMTSTQLDYFKQLIGESAAVPYEKIIHIIPENSGSDVIYILPKIRNKLITIRGESTR